MTDKEVRDLALSSGLIPQQANLVVATNQVYGTERALIVIKAFKKINKASSEQQTEVKDD